MELRVSVDGHETSHDWILGSHPASALNPVGGCSPDVTLQCVESDVKHPFVHLFAST